MWSKLLKYVIALSILVASSSCNLVQSKNLALNGLSSKQIFEAIVLGGEYSSELAPEIWEHPSVVKAREQVSREGHINAAREVSKRIEESNSLFFGQFEKQITSGDPKQVQAAFLGGLVEVEKLVKKYNPEYEVNLATSKNKNLTSQTFFAGFVAVLALGVAVTSYAVAVHTAGVKVLFVYSVQFLVTSSSSVNLQNRTMLSHEVMFARIAQRLAL
jgi:SdpC family antimicrobial peptide